MSTTVNNYAIAIAAGNTEAVFATLSPAIKLMAPAASQPVEGKEKTATMLSAAAGAVSGFTLVRTYGASDNWYSVLFEGTIDGTPVQFIDQVHIGEDNLVDHVDIFLRPATMAESLLGKMAAEIKKRSTKQPL